MILGGGVFGKELDHENGALINMINAPIRWDTREIVSLCHVLTRQEDSHL